MKRIGLVLLLGTLAACQKDRIEVRRVPKEQAPGALAESARPSGVAWKAPKGWKELPGDGMRAATFVLPPSAGKAEATVVALPGDVGGELANVNRWRGQIALPPLGAAELPALRRAVRCALGEIAVYDFSAPKSRLVAGMIQVDGTTWFFKLSGDAPAVAAAREAFLELLRGLKSDAP